VTVLYFTLSAFEELGVMPEIIQALEEIDWHLPTPVQTEAIPLILGGGDVAVAAETGAGKTGPFCLPILQIVYETQRTDLSNKLTAAASTASMAVAQGPICLSEYNRGRQVAVDVQKIRRTVQRSCRMAGFTCNAWRHAREVVFHGEGGR